MRQRISRLVLAGFAALCFTEALFAAAFNVIDAGYIQQKYYAESTATSSTHAVTGYGVGFNIEAIAGDVRFTVHQTTKTYDVNKGYGTPRSSSTVDVVTAGTSLNVDWAALTLDPSIVIHDHSVGTAKIRVLYLERRSQ